MAESARHTRFINPWVLHLQKMGLELKCPLCLNLLNRPMLLPCNHIFCSSCIPDSKEFTSDCPICKSSYINRDLRSTPHMENMVSIYKSMDAAFSANLSQQVFQADLLDVRKAKASNQCLASEKIDKDDKLSNEMIGATGNKRVQVSLRPSELERPMGSCMLRESGEVREFGKMGSKEEVLVGEQIPSSSSFLWSKDKHHNEGQNQGIDLNQVMQTSLDSPPSFGEAKDSDDDISGRSGEHSFKRLLPNGTIIKEVENATNTEIYRTPILQIKEEHLREAKRKKLDYGLQDKVINSGINAQSTCLDSENVPISKFGTEPEPCRRHFGAQPSSTSNCFDANPAVVCAFCQSSKLSEASGPMLHYDKGKPVVEDVLTRPNVLHVHRKCIEWAPQVYFVGENVMNLEAELARGAKLKCNSCGLKGAALGCYAKSCRKSFHVPCAVNIDDCRWDCENFLVLCPTHTSQKFPNERSKSNRNLGTSSSSTTLIASPQFNKVWEASSDTVDEWVLCGSALSSTEKNLLAKFARITGATISKIWKPNITHVIAAIDEIGACSRTLKVLMAILNGRWVLKIDWIKACMEAMHPVDEEPYEVGLDVHGCHDGPKNGRLRIMDKAPKLFSGINFYLSGDFAPAYKGYLEDLVLAAGGTILTKNILISQGFDPETVCSTTLVVYSLDPLSKYEPEEVSSVMEQRREEAETLAAQTRSWVVGHTWLLESIAACKLQPFAS